LLKGDVEKRWSLFQRGATLGVRIWTASSG
jgi:hypothetical protein